MFLRGVEIRRGGLAASTRPCVRGARGDRGETFAWDAPTSRTRSRQIEHEPFGDHEAMRTVGWVNWGGVYDQLPRSFSAAGGSDRGGGTRACRERDASVAGGRITTTGRGLYRKVQTALKR